MLARSWALRMAALAALACGLAVAQPHEAAIDVEHYVIQSEINPRTEDLDADVSVRFRALEDETRYLRFELHNDLQLGDVQDDAGAFVPASRDDKFSVRVTLPEAMAKDQVKTLRFRYHGRLTGKEESPVWGITFAAIHNDFAYLLYPSRWFPINGYTADRYTADMKITVPAGYRVVASGLETVDDSVPDKVTYSFQFNQPSFPGSIAVVQGDPQKVESQGVTTSLYFRGDKAEMAGAYGEEMGRVMTFLTGAFGLAPQRDLTVVETEDGTPNGYTAPGLLFLAPDSIEEPVNSRLLVNQVARQWWGMFCSAADRNHLWLTNGMARFAEILWLADTQGPAAADDEVKNQFVEALTVDKVPLIQSARLEDYSPEFWAATAGKGTAILQMLKSVIGDDPFTKLLATFTEQHPWQSVYTSDFRELAEKLSGRPLQGFFRQWIESSGAPEFRLEYTVYRTQKGFRVMGKIKQDLDTFRMPVRLRIETEGNPEDKQVEVTGPSTDFVVETFGKPVKVVIDPDNEVLRYSNDMRVKVAIRRGEQFAEIGDFAEAIKEYSRALEVNRYSSMAHYRIAEVFFLQRNYQEAANTFREALNGDLVPKWTEVWSHINLGKIFDITGQRERAVNEYNQALRTKDNTQGAQEVAAKYLQEPYQQSTQQSTLR